ncbi:MAG: 3-deoxy-manno-octulosonate cytidylyltransferase [Planctomycetota bacterium]
MKNVVGIIPARLNSTRLPQKLLLEKNHKTILQHTYESAQRANSLSEIIIATDSTQIQNAVGQFGGRCEMTGEHPSGTDRIAEVTRRCLHDADVIINIQADEPDIAATNIDLLAEAMKDYQSAEMASLAVRIQDIATLGNPSCTKVVCNSEGAALYFSRSLIPYARDIDPASLLNSHSPWLLHIGVYAYRREFLMRFTEAAPSPLEQLEKLEQLRALEMGARIQILTVDSHAGGIDTQDDYENWLRR